MTHVVWDWNGTLLDDSAVIVAAVNELAAAAGRPPVTLDEWRRMYRRPVASSYADLFGRPVTPAEWRHLDEAFHTAYRARRRDCALAAGVPDLLRDWRGSGGTQSLLSMSPHTDLVPMVAEYGLTDLFIRVDGAGPGGAGKAALLAEHLAAQRLDPDRVVVIGDVVDDAEAAEAAGARCVLVTTGMATVDALAATGQPVTESIAAALAIVAEELW